MPGDDRPREDLSVTVTVAGCATAPASVGTTLGRYRLEREVGAGGMGRVYAALDVDLQRMVAIKLLHPGSSAATRARLLREARAMARLHHPNVVTVFEVDTIEDTDFVVMELVDGGSLVEWLRGGRRPDAQILETFVAAGRGIAAAHAAGMVHRDFKPHNVLRSRQGRVAVTDFSLAREFDDDRALAAERAPTNVLVSLTVSGNLVGTPAYMAPEQWQPSAVSPAADQFSFCVALWEALAGERPFRGETREQLRAEVERGPAALDASKIPRQLRPVLLRGLALQPEQRWPTMEAMLEALAALSAPRRKRRTARRQR